MAKPSKAEQAAAARRHERFVAAGYVRDRFPEVERITLTETWRDPDHPRDDEKPTENVRGPDNSASYEITCRNWECVGGGIDLSREIQDMISNRETSLSGKGRCEGWQDAERVGKHRCWMELDYTVEVTYRDEDQKLA